MQTRRFFVAVWRVNAVLILLACLLACAALAGVLFMFYSDATRTRHADGIARVAVGGDMQSKATLGSFESLPKTAVLRAPLRVAQAYSVGSGSKEASSIRNYLYYQPDQRSTHWLKPSMDSLILRTWSVPEDEDVSHRTDWVAAVYAIVAKDSNGDGVLTEADQIQIASSEPDGTGYRVLVEKADHIHEARLIGTSRVLVLYSLGERLLGVEFNPMGTQEELPQHFEIKVPVVGKP